MVGVVGPSSRTVRLLTSGGREVVGEEWAANMAFILLSAMQSTLGLVRELHSARGR